VAVLDQPPVQGDDLAVVKRGAAGLRAEELEQLRPSDRERR
jgi:hypothetical protein